MASDLEISVEKLLRNLPVTGDARPLLAELNYDIVSEPLSTRDWGAAATENLAEDPALLAMYERAPQDQFQVICCRLKTDKIFISH